MNEREPLSSLSTNTPIRHLPNATSSSSSSSAGGSSSSSAGRKLAPIFVAKRKPATPESVHSRDVTGSPTSRKRVRTHVEPLSHTSSSIIASRSDEDEEASVTTKTHVRMHSIHDWFLPSTSGNYERVKEGKRREEVGVQELAVPTPMAGQGVWRRGRKRIGLGTAMGVGRGMGLVDFEHQRLIPTIDPYLSTLVTSLAPYHPLIPPSLLLLPSIHPPTGRPRDFAPPLSVAFNNIAKQWDATSARSAGLRRLIAVAGEEGGVRVLDVDEGLGAYREEKGFWWRAHGNAIFDLKWSADDTRVLTASGDQSTRIHALTTPTPTLLATLRGHTSSVKTTVFFDPSRSQSDPSTSSSIIATGGRDGNILIYDIRCQGRPCRESESPSPPPESASRSNSRERYRDGVPGFMAQHSGSTLDPVMRLRSAHGDGKRHTSGRTATRSVTSLVALQSMPGMLASGGSYDGIVKLWDLRFPAPTARVAEPRPTATAVGHLPDPTTHSPTPSRRPRSINALCESPTTGDLYALCGDSKVHTLRPSAAIMSSDPDDVPSISEATQRTFTDPNLLVSSFYIRLAVSPDGKHLASGSCRGGLMTWDTKQKDGGQATRLGMGMGGVAWPQGKEREVCAMDWGKDMIAATSDDLATRVWRENRQAAKWLRDDPNVARQEWAGSF
ncbi:hypothetical protein IAR55_006434 [Kwoniella newhampshirensis]|uniref:WD40 repeat-like protein n=1 Tax=Kwoniella newhampshirensis TaxID=1651941 RepID=A0AAW0YT71_9TREE